MNRCILQFAFSCLALMPPVLSHSYPQFVETTYPYSDTKASWPEESRANRDSNQYHTVRAVTLKANVRGGKLKARVETFKGKLENIIDREKFPYLSRIIIKNIKTGQIVYEEKFDDFFVSMYKRDLNRDSRDELILTTTPGAVSYHLMVFDFTSKKARLILEKSYRAEAVFVNRGNKFTDILITDAELGTGPYYTTRYVWQGDSYRAVKTIPYEEFSRNRRKIFQRKRDVSKRTLSMSTATSN